MNYTKTKGYYLYPKDIERQMFSTSSKYYSYLLILYRRENRPYHRTEWNYEIMKEKARFWRDIKTNAHCKDTIPKIPNKYSQKRNWGGHSPNSYLHVSVRELDIPTIGLPFLQQENRWIDLGDIKIAHRHMNVEIGTEDAKFLFWEYINRNFLQCR